MQPFNYSSSYEEFLARLRKSLQNQNISENILSLLESAFEKALNEQNVVLSRQERVRAYHTVSKEILTELLKQFDKS
jgi:uncharacterized protein YjcR